MEKRIQSLWRTVRIRLSGRKRTGKTAHQTGEEIHQEYMTAEDMIQMKFAKVLEKIIWNLVSWYYAAVFLHVGSTIADEQISMLKCIQYIVEVYGGVYLVLWSFICMLTALRERFGILVQFRRPIWKKKLRFPIIISKVL